MQINKVIMFICLVLSATTDAVEPHRHEKYKKVLVPLYVRRKFSVDPITTEYTKKVKPLKQKQQSMHICDQCVVGSSLIFLAFLGLSGCNYLVTILFS